MNYQEFLKQKTRYYIGDGININKDNLHLILFDFQKDFVDFALRKGRAAIFAGTGLGKTLMEIEFCRKATGSSLIITPLAVTEQTVKMAEDKMDVNMNAIASNNDIIEGINITNYEKMHKVDFTRFNTIVFDESSIFKGGGEFYKTACKKTAKHKFILCATATPAPNDYTELGKHSELLRIMKYREMKDRYFIKSGNLNQDIRLKRHAEHAFWKWIASWSIICREPKDLDYEQNGFNLPPLEIKWITIKTDQKTFPGELYPRIAKTLQERQKARMVTYIEKIKKAEEIIENNASESWLFWINRIKEGDYIERQVKDFIQVKGSDSVDEKVDRLLGFSSQKYKRLVTKPKIAGHGMNWQHCSHVIFFPTDSYEDFYQSIKRCHRFGQKNKVRVYIITADIEGNVKSNLLQKEKKNEEMYKNLIQHVKGFELENLGLSEKQSDYNPQKEMIVPRWLNGGKNESN